MALMEGSADRFTHTWAAMMMLFLSLVTWLLPLHPVFQGTAPLTPSYKADCWVPAQFEPDHLRYTNLVCSERFNAALRGQRMQGAYIYVLEVEEEKIPRWYRPPPSKNPNTLYQAFLGKRKILDPGRTNQRIVYKTVPVTLFVFAVCLTLPRTLWALFSGFASINTDNILESSTRLNLLKDENPRKLKEGVTRAVSDLTKVKSVSATALYLVYKFLLCAAVLLELIVLTRIVTDDLAAMKGGPDEGNSITKSMSDSQSEFDEMVAMPWLCEFSIAQVRHFHRYYVQCAFTETTAYSSSLSNEEATNGDVSQNGNNPKIAVTLYIMYRCIFTIVLASLVVLAVINVSSLLLLVSKLFPGPCPLRMKLMVEEKMGHLMRDLAGIFHGESDKGDKRVRVDGEGREEKKGKESGEENNNLKAVC